MPAIQRVRARRGTAAAWEAANPVLADGELGIATDTGVVKYGDGATAWNSLVATVKPAAGSVTEAMLAFAVATQEEIDAEATRALAAESALASDISGLTVDLGNLDSALGAEETARIAGDNLKVDKATLDANSVLVAIADDTPVALAVAASRVVGRKATGDVAALTGAEMAALVPDGTFGDGAYFRDQDDAAGAPTHGQNIIVGHSGNAIASDLGTATILGGGDTNYENVIGAASTANVNTASSNLPTANGTGANWSTITGGYDNVANGMASVVSGFHNVTESASTHGTISGGSIHKILDGDYSTIGGGTQNQISGDASTIGGGAFNIIEVGANRSTIAGGGQNTASGYAATIGGGEQHTASGTGSTVSGGVNNDATTHYATIGGGINNTASALHAIISGGNGNTASGQYAVIGGGSGNVAGAGNQPTVGGGLSNQATGASSTIAGGQLNTASGTAATVVGGRENTAGGNAATAMGREAKADLEGMFAQGSGKFAANGDAQTMVCVLRNQTADATQTELFLNGASGRLTLAPDCTWAFHILVSARRTDANDESAAYEFKGCIDRASGGATGLVGAVTSTVLGEDNAAWDVTVDADTTNASLRIRVTGEAAKTVRWVARVVLVQVIG